MPVFERLKQRSTLTGLAAVLFVIGVLMLFVALYTGAALGSIPLWALALGVLVATAVCWFAAAQWGHEPKEPSVTAKEEWTIPTDA